MRYGQQKQNGFSIIEILIVVIIMAILVSILAPALRTYIIKSNRSDAIKSLAALQVAEEKWRLTNSTYGALSSVWTGTASLEGYYTMSVTGNTATAYTISAVAGTTQSADTGCTTMTITYANGTSTKNTPSCWQ